MRVLVADDDSISRRVLRNLLVKWGYEPVEATDGLQAWEIMQAEDSPRLALVDWMMPGLDGPELCRRLRQSAQNDYHYIIMLTSRDSKEDLIDGMNAGADDYITKPYLTQELEVRLRVGQRIVSLQQSLQEALEIQRFQARHDPLTGLLNHGEILRILDQELQRADRQQLNLAIMMGDLDHFKKVNDTYGHVAGDAVLVEVSERIKKNLRLYDSIGRYGGEEFLLVLPGCSRDEAEIIANRIMNSVRENPVLFHDQQIPITISLGIAFNNAGAPEKIVDIIQAADTAMYQAKQNGRNRFELA
ncbi:MAG: diguanylate cyclase [Syntrophomonadaceae bacterium]|nr:diguanylate cyclase [Syntrophomonadaceae bacterium]